jgi:SAM-dependent methyltransferase
VVVVQYQRAPSRALPKLKSKVIPLAKGTRLSTQEDPGRLRSTFDGVASLYDEVRPGYPERLFDDLASLADARPGTRALEIGCGTGQATLPLARRGYRLLCVELGANLAAVTRTKLADYRNARVLTCSFEEWPPEEGAFDLVVSATAFHWVDPQVRYRKSAQALRPDGSLALIWNRADPEGSSEGFLEALEDVHRREAPELAPERRPPRLDGDADKADKIERSGYFERPEERDYRFAVAHDAESYLRLLGTYSAHRSLDEETRRRLLLAVGRLIDEEHGGRVIEGYRSELYVSRKR